MRGTLQSSCIPRSFRAHAYSLRQAFYLSGVADIEQRGFLYQNLRAGLAHPYRCMCRPSMASQAATSQATVLARTVCSVESNLEAVTVQQQACADRSTKLCIAGIDVEGVSVAGQETCVILPRLKVAFDVGRCPQRSIHMQTLLITHGHLDHIGGVPFHVTSRILQGLPPAKVVVPQGYEERLRRYVQAALDLQDNPPTAYELQELPVGQELSLPAPGHLVRPFQTTHTITSQGYIIYNKRNKLKAEHLAKGPEEIKALKLAGVDITDTITVPVVAFTGDTTSEFFAQQHTAQHPMNDVFSAKLLVMEMSFVDGTVTPEEARSKGHMHIDDFVAHADLFKNEAILLIHFSARYRRADIMAALDAQLPVGLKERCFPLLNGFD